MQIILRLARIFYSNSSRGAAQPYVEKEDDGLRRRLYVSYCPRSNPRLRQYTSGSRKPQQNYHEISGLARIFHHSRDEKAAKTDGARQTQDFYQGCMSTYCPDQNSSLTQQPSDFPAFAVERDERSGLSLFFLFFQLNLL